MKINSPIASPFELRFDYYNHSLRISGTLTANCAGSHIAVTDKFQEPFFLQSGTAASKFGVDFGINAQIHVFKKILIE